MSSERISGPSRRHFRLGPLGLVVDSSISFDVIGDWLPHTNVSNEDAPAAALSVSRDVRPPEPARAPALVFGKLQAWTNPDTDRTTILTPTAHAHVDLRARLGRVDPGEDHAGARVLLDLAASLVLARANAALLNASAVVDATGWGWLVVGAPRDRSRLAAAFVADGGLYVSDGQTLVRHAPLKPDLIILESWHRPHAEALRGGHGRGTALPWECWRPIAALRGLLLATPAHSPASPGLAWTPAPREAVAAAVVQSLPFVGADTRGDGNARALVDGCVSRAAYYATVNRSMSPGDHHAVERLRHAIEGGATY